jgi:CxxC motif-containing protein
MLPVRSTTELPKDKIQDCMKYLATHQATAPIRCGDIICHNILDTHVDIIASRDMEKEKL